jgi:hypothetical protein
VPTSREEAQVPPRSKPISQLSADELRARAAKVRAMAATATTKDIQNALYRLAERYHQRADHPMSATNNRAQAND